MSRTLSAGALALAALCGAAAWPAAHADEGRRARTPLAPRYVQECASCHVAYPPGMLPAASWQRLMGDLPHHYGTDASIDAVAQKELAAWLASHAGDSRSTRAQPPEDRITRTEWFVREHRGVAKDIWSRPSVKSPSNCSACHTQADRGDFDEHAVRIPR